MYLYLPFLRFLASKLGEGQSRFLLMLLTVDPGTGISKKLLFSVEVFRLFSNRNLFTFHIRHQVSSESLCTSWVYLKFFKNISYLDAQIQRCQHNSQKSRKIFLQIKRLQHSNLFFKSFNQILFARQLKELLPLTRAAKFV